MDAVAAKAHWKNHIAYLPPSYESAVPAAMASLCTNSFEAEKDAGVSASGRAGLQEELKRRSRI